MFPVGNSLRCFDALLLLNCLIVEMLVAVFIPRIIQLKVDGGLVVLVAVDHLRLALTYASKKHPSKNRDRTLSSGGVTRTQTGEPASLQKGLLTPFDTAL